MIIPVADRLQSAAEYYFSQKVEAIAKMRERGIDVINLGIGSPDLPPASDVIKQASEAMHSSKSHGYAPYRSSPELRKAMADWYLRTYKVELNSAKQVLPLLGSKEGILYATMAFLNPGDTVLVPNPGYPAYASVANLLGVHVHYYDLSEASAWQPNLEALEKIDLSKVKLMWVNYPHMPTGATALPDLFEKLIAFGRKHHILICNDNPYGLVLNINPPQSILSFDPSGEVAMEFNSMSKAFNMAGWRVGMALGSEPMINALLQVKSNVDSGMFSAVQAGAVKAFSLPDKWHEERNKIYASRRDIVLKIFETLGFSVAKNQVGLFVWAKAPDHMLDVSAFVDRLLDEGHVFLTPGMVFGSNGARYGRSSLCASIEVLQKALERIQAFVANTSSSLKGFP